MIASDRALLMKMINANPTSSTAHTLNGANQTITKNIGARAVVLQPAHGNANVIGLKGAAGDTGITMDPRFPTLLSLADADASFLLLGTSGDIVNIEFFNEA